MFLNSWSIALTLTAVTVIILLILAAKTAVGVLLYWDIESDNSLQIKLENQTWLASTLVEYALCFQIISLVLFVLAADQFSLMITGAMCATGALLANNWGMPTLFVKMIGVFLYGFWVVVHRLDISSEEYPLLQFKYRYLLLLMPVIVADLVMQTLYISGLEPDIITSCCAVVFGEGSTSPSLGLLFSQESLVPAYILLALSAAAATLILHIKKLPGMGWKVFESLLYLCFFLVAIEAITGVFSSYIYAMPFHKCPFCILKPEYHYIGLLIYGTLFLSVFFGISKGLVLSFRQRSGLSEAVDQYVSIAGKIALISLVCHVVVTVYPMITYLYLGGE